MRTDNRLAHKVLEVLARRIANRRKLTELRVRKVQRLELQPQIETDLLRLLPKVRPKGLQRRTKTHQDTLANRAPLRALPSRTGTMDMEV